jgi:hypothetical protein
MCYKYKGCCYFISKILALSLSLVVAIESTKIKISQKRFVPFDQKRSALFVVKSEHILTFSLKRMNGMY